MSKLTTLFVPVTLTLTLGACGSDSNGGGNHPDATGSGSGNPPDGVIAIPLKSLDATGYTGPITVGTQTFDAIYDTGSSTIGIADTSCTTCMASPKYTAEASAVDQHMTGKSQYGDGSGWNGEIFQDMSKLGGGPGVALKFVDITSQTKGSQGQYFFHGGYSGIVGLGPDGALLAGTSSYITGAVGTGMPGVMAFQLCPDKGTMWLGGYDPAAVDGTVEYSPIVPIAGMSGLYYAVNTGAAAIDGTDLGVASADFGPTIVDTGTTISFVPTAVLNKLTTAINASAATKAAFGSTGFAGGSCLHTTMTSTQLDATLPKLGITFAGGTTPVAMPATKAYLFNEGQGNYCFAFGDSSQLFGGFKASLFGASMLNGMIAVFDVANKQLGFAAEKGCANTQRVLEAAAPDAPAIVIDPSRPWYESDPRVRLPTFAF